MKTKKTSSSALLLRGAAHAALARQVRPALVNRLLPITGMLALAASLQRWREAAETPQKSETAHKQRPPTRRRVTPGQVKKGGAS
jgi:hypothetical protein